MTLSPTSIMSLAVAVRPTTVSIPALTLHSLSFPASVIPRTIPTSTTAMDLSEIAMANPVKAVPTGVLVGVLKTDRCIMAMVNNFSL